MKAPKKKWGICFVNLFLEIFWKWRKRSEERAWYYFSFQLWEKLVVNNSMRNTKRVDFFLEKNDNIKNTCFFFFSKKKTVENNRKLRKFDNFESFRCDGKGSVERRRCFENVCLSVKKKAWGGPVTATFWVNASRVIPLLTNSFFKQKIKTWCDVRESSARKPPNLSQAVICSVA